MKHKGTFEDLKTLVRGVGREITHSGPSGSAHQIKTGDGAVINWFESTGTVQFQGATEAKKRIEADLAAYTGSSALLHKSTDRALIRFINESKRSRQARQAAIQDHELA